MVALTVKNSNDRLQKENRRRGRSFGLLDSAFLLSDHYQPRLIITIIMWLNF